MVSIEKTNKPDSFAALYQLANSGPNARSKVPLLDAKLLHTIPPPSSSSATAGGTTPITKREPETERIVLCESTVITEFLAQQQQQQQQQQVQQQQQEGGENHRPALLLPDDLQERAKIRLFLELCGNAFNSYVPFLRVQNEEQLTGGIYTSTRSNETSRCLSSRGGSIIINTIHNGRRTLCVGITIYLGRNSFSTLCSKML